MRAQHFLIPYPFVLNHAHFHGWLQQYNLSWCLVLVLVGGVLQHPKHYASNLTVCWCLLVWHATWLDSIISAKALSTGGGGEASPQNISKMPNDRRSFV